MSFGGIFRCLGATVVLLALAACGTEPSPDASEANERFNIYLVRHAEKTVEQDDPDLTEAGLARAELLAELLGDEPIRAVWSTDYRRTQMTAVPLAARLGLDVRSYDAADLGAFAAQLLEEGETAVIVGHSNTTPQLSVELGGEPGEPIVEATEYDRLYVLTISGEGEVDTDIRRFGASHDGGTE